MCRFRTPPCVQSKRPRGRRESERKESEKERPETKKKPLHQRSTESNHWILPTQTLRVGPKQHVPDPRDHSRYLIQLFSSSYPAGKLLVKQAFCKSGKQLKTCLSALCTMDDASYFPVIRLGPMTSKYEKNVTVVSTVTGFDVTN